MFVFGGVREIGRVERCDETWITTRFVQLNFLPIVPLGTTLRVGTGERRDLPLDVRSVAAAYLRSWPFLLAAGALLFPHLGVATRLAGLGVALALLAIGWLALGRVSRIEAAKRRVLAAHIGAPVNLAWVRDELPRVREALHDQWNETAAQAGARGYRAGADLEDAVELDDEVALRLAFSLARVEATLAEGRARGRLRALEDRIWSRLEAIGAGARGGALPGPPASRAPA
jgi:hypothetical protein